MKDFLKYKSGDCTLIYDIKKHNRVKYISIVKGLGPSPDTLVIPQKIDDLPVKVIHSYAFVSRTIKHVVLPEGLEQIGPSAFEDCSLEDLVCPKTLNYIGENAFKYCGELRTVDLNEGLQEIPDGAFYNCSDLTNITIPESVVKIGKYAFYNASIESVRFGSNLKEIDRSAFEDCDSLKKIIFNEGLVSIKDSVFYGIAAKNIRLPESLESLGYSAFDNCSSLESLYIGKGLTKYENKNLTNYDIEDDFLYDCESLKKITVSPENKCLKDIDGILFDSNAKTLIRVPPKISKKILLIPSSTKSVASCCFADVCMDKIVIKSKHLKGIHNSLIEDSKNIACIPNSEVDKDLKKFFNIKSIPAQSDLGMFLDDLSEEKTI